MYRGVFGKCKNENCAYCLFSQFSRLNRQVPIRLLHTQKRAFTALDAGQRLFLKTALVLKNNEKKCGKSKKNCCLVPSPYALPNSMLQFQPRLK